MQNVFRMDAIKTFFKEVITFNVVDGYNDTYSYNGIKLEESSVAFQKKLQCLYDDALMEIPLLNNDIKNGFIGIIDRYKECQNGFDVPDELCLTSMNKEIVRGNRNPQLIKQRDFVKMLRECVSLQKYYLNEFATDIGYISEEQVESQTIASEEQANSQVIVPDEQESPKTITSEKSVNPTTSNDGNIIKGVRGLADFLGCGVNTAQNIINSEILLKKKIQYNTGKGWRFRKDKLTELLEKEPEILKKVRKK